jgi:hypothetical protein
MNLSHLNPNRFLSLAVAGACLLLPGAGVAATVTTAFLPSGTEGSRYYAQLAATGPAPLTWSLAPGSGPLPPNLTLAANGIISGSNSSLGNFEVTIRVQDASSAVADQNLTIAVLPNAPGAPFRWDDRFGPVGLNGYWVNAMAANGTNLYVGGNFTAAAGYSIALWNGRRWSPVAGGLGWDSAVFQMAVGGTNIYVAYHDGYSGGYVPHVAKWDGAKWTVIGSMNADGQVYALAFSDGFLYAGGAFTNVDGLNASHTARWDGTRWSVLGNGVAGTVRSMSVSGTTLYAGGFFMQADGAPANHVAKWDGTNWSALGDGINSAVYSVAASGNDVYVGGTFTMAGGRGTTNIAKWDGSNWSPLGNGVGDAAPGSGVATILVHGALIYVGGTFNSAGSVSATNFAGWDGSTWTGYGSGVGDSNSTLWTIALCGTDLYAGGDFKQAGDQLINLVARLNVSGWTALGRGVTRQDGSLSYLNAVAADGSGFYVGGRFDTAGGISATNIAHWDGNCWSPLGGGVDDAANALAVNRDEVYVGGAFHSAGGNAASNIAKWDGSAWSALGNGVDNTVWTLAIDGTNLYAGGEFIRAGSTANANGIAKWDGSNWSGLGGGVSSGPTPRVYAVAVSGTNIYMGGQFSAAGGSSGITNIACWNGSNWSPLSNGINGVVYALAVSGTNLYAGGRFTKAGGVATANIARWNGSSWSPIGGGLTGSGAEVWKILLRGEVLYVGGPLTNSAGVGAYGVAKWNGTNWSKLDTGIKGAVADLAISGTNLYAGGSFYSAGPYSSQNFAHWVLSAGPPLLSFPTRISTNRFQFILNGAAGQTYTIQASTNLSPANWFNILTTNAITNAFTIVDSQATNRQRFYRAIAAP